jgi:hypothetical protein
MPLNSVPLPSPSPLHGRADLSVTDSHRHLEGPVKRERSSYFCDSLTLPGGGGDRPQQCCHSSAPLDVNTGDADGESACFGERLTPQAMDIEHQRASGGGRTGEMVQSKLMMTHDGSLLLSTRGTGDGGRNTSPGICPQQRLDERRQTTVCEAGRNRIWTDVRNMDRGELNHTATLLGSADECGMVLIFANQSSQLREQKVWWWDDFASPLAT